MFTNLACNYLLAVSIQVNIPVKPFPKTFLSMGADILNVEL